MDVPSRSSIRISSVERSGGQLLRIGRSSSHLTKDAEFGREFPPRLPEQPIFYPVLTEDYARQIARDWNVLASGAGYVTRTDGSASIWAGVNDTMESTVDKIVSVVIDETLPPRIERVIADRLNLSPFVFPGGAQLNLVNPLFNDAGDLLFGVSQKS